MRSPCFLYFLPAEFAQIINCIGGLFVPVIFSFIIPVYNCAPYLENCVASILAQTVCDYEILLIDDGSKDESGRLCDELAAQDSRIRAFHKENGGAASARNYGLDQADGKWILFVDGDDMLEADTLAQIQPLLREKRLVIYGMAFDYYAGERIERTDLMAASRPGLFSAEQFASDYQGFFLDNYLSSACNKAFDLGLIRESGLRYREGMNLYEDYAFVLRYLSLVHEVYCIGHGLYHYRLSTQENHLHKLVYQIDRLEWNMLGLFEAAECFGNSVPDPSKLNSSVAGVFLQMLSLHLFLHHYNTKTLKSVTISYCANHMFRKLLENGGPLSREESSLLRQIDEGRFFSLALHYRKRFLRWQIRKAIKKVLRKIR